MNRWKHKDLLVLIVEDPLKTKETSKDSTTTHFVTHLQGQHEGKEKIKIKLRAMHGSQQVKNSRNKMEKQVEL